MKNRCISPLRHAASVLLLDMLMGTFNVSRRAPIIENECFEGVRVSFLVFAAVMDGVCVCLQASEMLLPRIVELRTECTAASTELRASRRNDRRSDVERFALELASMFPQ